MRKISPLDPLISKTVQGVLASTMMSPGRWWYLSDLARHLNRRPSTLQKPLSALVESGILRRRLDGNRVYFQPDPDCPFYDELRSLVAKTVGLVDVLRELLEPFETKIAFAFVYGSIARGEEFSESDIDLMVIGQVTRFELAKILRQAQQRLARPVNVSLYTAPEFAKKVASHEHFISAVLEDKKLFVVGNAHDMERTRSAAARRKRTDKQDGD